MTFWAWLFLAAWALTSVVCMGYMSERDHLRKDLDCMIDKMTDLLTDDQAHSVLVNHIKARNPEQ